MKRAICLFSVGKAESILLRISNQSGHAFILDRVILCLNEPISTRHEQAVMNKEEPHKNEVASERSFIANSKEFLGCLMWALYYEHDHHRSFYFILQMILVNIPVMVFGNTRSFFFFSHKVIYSCIQSYSASMQLLNYQ